MQTLIKQTYFLIISGLVLFLISFKIHAQSQQFSYGLHLGLNYPTIGAQYDNYSGEGNPTFGMFILKRPERGLDVGHPAKNKRYTLIPDEFVRRLTFIAQPSFSINSFREQASDRKYNNYYLEFNGLMYVQPFAFTPEFNLFTGIRPSYLISYNTEIFEFGSYATKNYDGNLNSVGRIDFCMPFGISIALSEAVSIEVAYNQSFTNKNTEQVIKGRPSSVEATIRLNAIGLVNQFGRKEDVLRAQINNLSKGALLVMLPTPSKAEIDRLTKDHMMEEVAFLKSELTERNKRVMREFKSYFTFCPVYFFMDTNAYRVISKKFDGIFVNNQLEVEPTIKPDSSNFFVASICDDISAYTSKHQFGLFVYDDNINQLPKPFNVPGNLIGANLEGDPLNYFRKKRYNYSIMSFEGVITKFNNRLLKYKD